MNLSHSTFDSTARQFGVEQEQFVLHDNGTAPSHEEIDRLWAGLCGSGFQIHAVNNHGRVLSVARMVTQGLLVVTNDSCTHIVEVALPPYRSLTDFRRDYCETWGLVTEQLRGLGLQLRLGGALPMPVREVHWRPKETDPEGERLYKLVHREPLNTPLFHSAFPACFAATHISLGVREQEAINLLAGYYSFEFLVPLWFSTSPQFQSVKAHCVRPLAWEANFHQPYPLLGIPDPLPCDLAEYELYRSQCFLRDYSFVAIRNAERLEFRSACSQPTVEAVEQLISFRMAIDAAVRDGVTGDWCPRTAFDDACLGRPVAALPKARELLGPYLDGVGLSVSSIEK
ncbi:hypothetical protein [Schlesneria sp. DSM 10557]|uniref:hypothetical protein n=1 Tax=Schlesneria sp. DSM 10557 TaxID=3044399 RepID=UPI0035A03EAB